MKRRSFIYHSALLPLISPSRIAFGAEHDPDLQSSSEFPDNIMSADLVPKEGKLNVLLGEIPNDIQGHIFMCEGIPLEKNHLSPNGKGAITRFDFSPTDVFFKRRMIETPSAILQNYALSGLEKFALLGGTAYLSPKLGFMNYCNTAPNYMGDNRFALSYEGGMPFEYNPDTLALTTSIGNVEEWRTSLPPFADFFVPDKWLFPQIRTTAHPYFDSQNGECFTINFGGNIGDSGLRNAYIDLIHWDFYGKFNRWNIHRRDGQPSFIANTAHSMSVTRNHIIIYETAAHVETNRFIGFRNVRAQNHTTSLWVIRKSDLVVGNTEVVADYLTLDFDTSDIVCDYDDHDGEITLYGQYLGAMDKSEPLFANEERYFGGRIDASISGYSTAPVDVGGLVRARIQVTASEVREIKQDFKVIRDLKTTWDMNDPAYRGHFQFPETFSHMYWSAIGYRPEHLVKRVTEAYENYPNRLFTNESLPDFSIPSALIHLDCQNMSFKDIYHFPDDCVMRTPQFMSKPHSYAQDEGYIFTAVVRKYPSSTDSSGKEIWIFDAKKIGDGPICQLGSKNLNFATSNHALWVESYSSPGETAYRSNLALHLQEKSNEHSKKIRNIVNEVIVPRFS